MRAAGVALTPGEVVAAVAFAVTGCTGSGEAIVERLTSWVGGVGVIVCFRPVTTFCWLNSVSTSAALAVSDVAATTGGVFACVVVKGSVSYRLASDEPANAVADRSFPRFVSAAIDAVLRLERLKANQPNGSSARGAAIHQLQPDEWD